MTPLSVLFLAVAKRPIVTQLKLGQCVVAARSFVGQKECIRDKPGVTYRPQAGEREMTRSVDR
jgi:hypothetical protein